MPGPMTQASRLKKDSGLVQHLIKAVPARTAELAGIKILNLLYTANINMTHVFKHPKFYRIPRDKSDQVISKEPATAGNQRAPGPGQTSKPQASSYKLPGPRPISNANKGLIHKPQASSSKPQAPSKSKTLEQDS